MGGVCSERQCTHWYGISRTWLGRARLHQFDRGACNALAHAGTTARKRDDEEGEDDGMEWRGGGHGNRARVVGRYYAAPCPVTAVGLCVPYPIHVRMLVVTFFKGRQKQMQN